MTPDQLDEVIHKAVWIAGKNIGFGEDSKNNAGKWLDLIGSQPGWEWCAVAAGYFYRRAHELLELPPPAWCYRRPGVLEPGARALVQAMGKVGRLYKDPTLAKAGDLVLWTRWALVKGIPTRKAHVEFIEFPDDGLVNTIAGNVGKVPAKTKRLVHDVTKEPHFETFASLRRAASAPHAVSGLAH